MAIEGEDAVAVEKTVPVAVVLVKVIITSSPMAVAAAAGAAVLR